MFIEDIKEKAKKSPKTIVLPEGNEERTLRAVKVQLYSPLFLS